MDAYPKFVPETVPAFKKQHEPWMPPADVVDENPIPLEDRYGSTKSQRLAMAQPEFEACWKQIMIEFDAYQTKRISDHEAIAKVLSQELSAQHKAQKDAERADEAELKRWISARGDALEQHYKDQLEQNEKNGGGDETIKEAIRDNRGPSLRALSQQDRNDLGTFQDHCSDVQRLRRKEEDKLRDWEKGIVDICREQRSDFGALRRAEERSLGNAAAQAKAKADEERWAAEAAVRKAERDAKGAELFAAAEDDGGDDGAERRRQAADAYSASTWGNCLDSSDGAERRRQAQEAHSAASTWGNNSGEEISDATRARIEERRQAQLEWERQQEQQQQDETDELAADIEWERTNLSPEEFELAQLNRKLEKEQLAAAYNAHYQREKRNVSPSSVCGKIYLTNSSGDRADFKVHEVSGGGADLKVKKVLYLSNPPKKGEWEIVKQIGEADYVLKLERAGKVDFTFSY